MSTALDDLRRWLRDLPPPPTRVDWAWVESEPDYQGLLLWGEIDSEVLLCWDMNSSRDPDEWRTVAFNSVGHLDWLDGNMTTCLRDMINGRQRPAVAYENFSLPEPAVSIRGEQFPLRLDD